MRGSPIASATLDHVFECLAGLAQLPQHPQRVAVAHLDLAEQRLIASVAGIVRRLFCLHQLFAILSAEME